MRLMRMVPGFLGTGLRLIQFNNPASTNYHKNKHETKPPIPFQVHTHRCSARFRRVNGRLDSQECLRGLFATINGDYQNRGGSIFHYTAAGTKSTFGPPLDRPRGMAFDTVGNLFVATTTLDSPSRV